MGTLGSSSAPSTAQVQAVNQSLSSGGGSSSLSDLTYRGSSGGASASDFLGADSYHIDHSISFQPFGGDALRSYNDYGLPSTSSDYAAGGKLTFTEAPKSEPTTWIDFSHDDADLALFRPDSLLDTLTLQPDGTAPLGPDELASKKQAADAQWLAAHPGADPVTGLTPVQSNAALQAAANAKWFAEHPGADPITGLTPAPVATGQFPTTFDPTVALDAYNQTGIGAGGTVGPIINTPYYLPDPNPHPWTHWTDPLDYHERGVAPPTHQPGTYDPVNGFNTAPGQAYQMLLDGTLLRDPSAVAPPPTGGVATPPALSDPTTLPGSGPSSLLTFPTGPSSTPYHPATVPPGASANPDPATLAQVLPTSPIFDPTNPISFTTTDTLLQSVTPVTPSFPADPSANDLMFGRNPFPTTGGQLIAYAGTDPILPAAAPDNQFAQAPVAPSAQPALVDSPLFPNLPPEVRGPILQYGLDSAAALYIGAPDRYGALDATTPSWVLQGVQGRLGVPQTGTLDDATVAAIVRLQAAWNLPQTGIIDTHVMGLLKYMPNGAGMLPRVGDSANALGATDLIKSTTDLEAALPHHGGLEPREIVFGDNGQVIEANWPSNLAAPATMVVDGQEVPFSNQLGLPDSITRITASDMTVGDAQAPDDATRDIGQPIIAPGNMRVLQTDPGSGLVVLENVAATTVPLAGGRTALIHERLVTLHLDQILVRPGDVVAPGQVFGTQGTTATAAVHTHFVGTNQMRIDFLNAQTRNGRRE